jgi:hypothetical protein
VRFIVLLAVLSACAPPQARDSFVLKVAMWGPLGRLRPLDDEPHLASTAMPWVFEKLASIDDAGQLRPVLASEIERLPGGRLRMSLRRDATFSDGSPVTDADVIRSLMSNRLRATVVDGGLIVESREQAIPAEVLLIRAGVFREVAGRLLGSGPFVVATESDRELRLVRRKARRARINEVLLVAYSTPREAFAHTLKGDANAILDLDPRSREFFDGVPSLRVIRGTGRSTHSIIFNLDLPRDERVRLAAVLASEQVRELAYGPGECAESRTAGGDHPSPPEGRPLSIIAWGPLERLALAARRGLAERGGEVLMVSPPDVLKRARERQFDLFTARPIMWPPTAMFLSWRTGSPDNVVGYSNPTLDQALDAADWAAARAALRDDPPAAFICTRDHLAVVDARIKNPMLGPYDLLETLSDWEIAP